MGGTGHHSLEMKEIGHQFLEMIGIGHHFLGVKEILHFLQEVVGIVGHHPQGMKEKDGLHFLEMRWTSLVGQENVVHQADLCLPLGEVEGEDLHSMKMREEDLSHHHPGPPEVDDLLQVEILEGDLHLLRNLIDLVVLCHLLQTSLMIEGGHHQETGIGGTVSTFQPANSLLLNGLQLLK